MATSNNKYKYRVGGITIGSDIYYPELIIDNSIVDADVLLAYGDVPETLDDNKANFPIVQANANNYLLKIPRIGRYLVSNGRQIIIQPEDGALSDDVRKQSLTAVLAMLGYQRSYIMMHGGIVILDGGAVLITGISAMGKSLLLAALYQKGYQVISDDISYLKIINEKVIAFPSFPRIMLWKDSLRRLQLKTTDATKLRDDMEKYFYPVDDAAFLSPVAINKVCVLTSAALESTHKAVSGFEKISYLRDNFFHPWMLGPMGRSNYYASQALNMASLVDIVLLENDHSKDINELVHLFIEKMRHA